MNKSQHTNGNDGKKMRKHENNSQSGAFDS